MFLHISPWLWFRTVHSTPQPPAIRLRWYTVLIPIVLYIVLMIVGLVLLEWLFGDRTLVLDLLQKGWSVFWSLPQKYRLVW